MNRFKICSSNIRFENNNDGQNSWINRLPLLSTFFTKNQFAIIGTQEGREPQLRSLENKIPHSLQDQHREWIVERMYPAIFLKQHFFEVILSGDIWLSETPSIPGSTSFNSAFPRLATWVQLKTVRDAKSFIVINVHLDHVKSETRIEQVRVLTNEIKKILNLNPLPIILMGDFNDSPESEVHQKLIHELKLTDPWIAKKMEEETSHHGFLGNKSSGSRIDWILLSEEWIVENIYLEKMNADGIFLSDHYPLVATLIPNW
jgi:endonuclease/exonuclease/phosphatase family metal-dependent hydrolase